MNHLGVVFGDTFELFWVFGWISEKGTKSANLGIFGVLRCGVGIPRSGVVEREAWTSLGYAEA